MGGSAEGEEGGEVIERQEGEGEGGEQSDEGGLGEGDGLDKEEKAEKEGNEAQPQVHAVVQPPTQERAHTTQAHAPVGPHKPSAPGADAVPAKKAETAAAPVAAQESRAWGVERAAGVVDGGVVGVNGPCEPDAGQQQQQQPQLPVYKPRIAENPLAALNGRWVWTWVWVCSRLGVVGEDVNAGVDVQQ